MLLNIIKYTWLLLELLSCLLLGRRSSDGRSIPQLFGSHCINVHESLSKAWHFLFIAIIVNLQLRGFIIYIIHTCPMYIYVHLMIMYIWWSLTMANSMISKNYLLLVQNFCKNLHRNLLFMQNYISKMILSMWYLN